MPTQARTVEGASFPIKFDCNADYWTGNDPPFKTTISAPVTNGGSRSPVAIRYRGLSLDGNIEFAEDGSIASIKAVGSLDGKAKELTLTPNVHDNQRAFLSGSLQPPGDKLLGRHCEATYFLAAAAGGGEAFHANFGATDETVPQALVQTQLAKGADLFISFGVGEAIVADQACDTHYVAAFTQKFANIPMTEGMKRRISESVQGANTALSNMGVTKFCESSSVILEGYLKK